MCERCTALELKRNDIKLEKIKKHSDPNKDLVLKRLIQTRRELNLKQDKTDSLDEKACKEIRDKIFEIDNEIYRHRQKRLRGEVDEKGAPK